MTQPQQAHGPRTFVPMRTTDLEQGKDGMWAVCFRNLLNLSDMEIKIHFHRYGDLGPIRNAGTWTFVRFLREEDARDCLQNQDTSYLGDLVKPARNTNMGNNNGVASNLELEAMPGADVNQTPLNNAPPPAPAENRPANLNNSPGYVRGRSNVIGRPNFVPRGTNPHYQGGRAAFNQSGPQPYNNSNFRGRGRGNYYNPRQGAPMQQARGPTMHHQAPPMQQQAPPMQQQAPPMQQQAPPIQQQAPPMQQQAPPMQQQAPPMQQQGPPMQQQAPFIHPQAPMQRQAPPMHPQAASLLLQIPPMQPQLSPETLVEEQVRKRLERLANMSVSELSPQNGGKTSPPGSDSVGKTSPLGSGHHATPAAKHSPGKEAVNSKPAQVSPLSPAKNNFLADIEKIAWSKQQKEAGGKMNGVGGDVEVKSSLILSNLPAELTSQELQDWLRREDVLDISVVVTPDHIRYCHVQVATEEREKELLDLDSQLCRGQPIFAKRLQDVVADGLRAKMRQAS